MVLFAGLSMSQWNQNAALNTPVSVSVNDQQDLRICSDGRGGAIVTWDDYRSDINNADIYVQRIDSSGYVKWAANGVALCTAAGHQASPVIVEDGTGGAIIVWQDWRSGERDIYAQRIDKTGSVKWAANGIGVTTKPGQQMDPKCISDGSNGAIITWQDSSAATVWDIYAQRIDSNGALKWFAGGEMICTATNDQINPKIENDGFNNGVITWQDKRNNTDYDIYAQMINSAGAVQWAVNGKPVCVYNYPQVNPKIEPDGTGGVYIAWQDKRWGGANYDIYAQHLNSFGSETWSTNGVGVCIYTGNQSAIDMASEGVNGVIITWKDGRGLYNDIYAQRVSPVGIPKWSANGIVISNAAFEQINPNIVSDGYGGANIVWQDSSGTGWDVYSQRVDSNGAVLWPANGVPVGNATNNQTSPKQISDGKGGIICAFQDKRSATFDIYAHHLDASGNTSIRESGRINLPRVIVTPNPSNEITAIMISLNPEIRNWKIEIFEVSGKRIISDKISDNDIFLFDTAGREGGIYFYRITLTDDNEINLTGKFIIE